MIQTNWRQSKKSIGNNPRSRKQDVSYRLHKLELFITRWKTNREDTDTQTYKKATEERNILCFQWIGWMVQETAEVKIQFRWLTEKKKPNKF